MASVRTKKKALKRLMDEFNEVLTGKELVGIGVMHSEAAADATKLGNELQARYPNVLMTFSEITPVVGTHVGPGALGIGYVYR